MRNMGSDFLLGQASLSFRSDTQRSDLFQTRSDLRCSQIRRCNMWPALRLGWTACAFRQGARRSGLVQDMSDLFFQDPCVQYGTRYRLEPFLVHFLAGRLKVRPSSGQVRSISYKVRKLHMGSDLLWPRPHILVAQAPGGTI